MRWLTGSQCSCFRTGLIWSYFLVRVITRAAAFRTFCKRSIGKVGSPCNSELALSSLEVINLWTSFSVSGWDKQSLILPMFLRWKKQALQILVTCLSSDMCSSKITLMFLADEVGLIRSPDTSIYSFDGGGRCRALRTKSSISPLFSLSLLLTIHELISETHASILVMAPACSAGVDLNERYSWVSSV